jgi:hypothetical protein
MAGNGSLRSKKFIAFMASEFTWKILAALVLFWGKDSIPQQVFIILLAIIIVAGFVETGYIIGQASLDKFVRVAEIAVANGKQFSMKGMSVEGTPKPAEGGTVDEKATDKEGAE